MAKERAEKPRKERKEKAEKAEKKVSKDKVKKHKKEKKVKHEASSDESDNEPSKLEESPAAVEEPSAEPAVAEPASELKSEKEEKRADKKDKSKKKDKKSKKAAIEAAITDGASNESTKLPMRPASKDEDEDEDGGAPLFTIDTKPTKVDLEAVAEKGDAMDEDKPENEQHEKGAHQKSGYNPPPSGLNRQERRRIRMIEERREKIQKDLGMPVGSQEKADEVQAKLDAWVEDFDAKAAIRIEKKKRRKEKEAARIKSKRGKLLTGRRLKERKKELQKMEKASKKQRGGLSAVNTKS